MTDYRPMPRDRSHRPAKKKSGGWFMPLVIGLVSIVVLAAGAVALAAAFLPTDFIRDKVVAAVKDKTGRDLTIAGPTSFTVYPSLGVTLGDVSLSSAPGMSADVPFVKMRTLEARVALMPLLSQNVKVQTLVLYDPEINLIVDQAGQKSWAFPTNTAALPQKRIQLAQADTGDVSQRFDFGGRLTGGAEPAATSSSAASALKDLSLDDVRIVNGTVNYADEQTGTRETVRALNTNIALTEIAAPLTANGNLVLKGRKVDFETELTSVKDVLEERPAKVALAVQSQDLKATFDGSASFKDGVNADGAVTASSPSVRNLAKWFGTELPPSRGFGPLDTKGNLRITPAAITYYKSEIGLDGAVATGQIAFKPRPTRPLVDATLKLTVLDLNNYMSTDASGGAAPQPAAAPTPAPPSEPANNGAPTSIEDLLRTDPADPTRVRGYTQRAGSWSEQPFDLAALTALDLNTKLSIGRILVADMKLGQTELDVALKTGVLKTTIREARLYDGRASGFITANGSSGNTLGLSSNLAFADISAAPFLKDSAGFDRLSGRGNLNLALSGKGRHQQALMQTLNGNVTFNFADGAITGVNLPQMMRSVRQGNLTDFSSSPTEKTDFSELKASFTVTNGIAQNQDLILVSPLLRVTGSGRVMVPTKEIDYLIRPRIVSDLSGQGGALDSSGLEIPVRVTGSLENPSFVPDLTSLVQDPSGAIDAVRKIGKDFKDKGASDIIKDVLGGSGGNVDGAKQLLEGFFGR